MTEGFANGRSVGYYDDPRYGPEVVQRADVVVLRGQFY